jgi:branched-chain amino acid transport system permease protein
MSELSSAPAAGDAAPVPPSESGPGTGPAWRRWLGGSALVRHLAITAVAGAVLFVASLWLSPFNDLRLANGAYYFVTLAGLTLLTGLSGQISLGQGGLVAAGAYTSALLIANNHWALVPALLASVVVASAVGALLGVAGARLRGPYLAGATLAFALALPGITDRFAGTFGGENGITTNAPTPPASLGATFSLERWQAWIACLAALVVLLLLLNLSRGGSGRTLRAVRDDEVAASLCGINVARTQVSAFIVSAACAGVGGALYVEIQNLAAPDAFTVTLSLYLLAGVVLGGLGSLAGAVYGAIVLVMLPSWSTDLAGDLSLSGNVSSNLPLAFYGIVLIAAMLAAPLGIQGLVLDVTRRLRSRRGSRPGALAPASASPGRIDTERPTGGEG